MGDLNLTTFYDFKLPTVKFRNFWFKNYHLRRIVLEKYKSIPKCMVCVCLSSFRTVTGSILGLFLTKTYILLIARHI